MPGALSGGADAVLKLPPRGGAAARGRDGARDRTKVINRSRRWLPRYRATRRAVVQFPQRAQRRIQAHSGVRLSLCPYRFRRQGSDLTIPPKLDVKQDPDRLVTATRKIARTGTSDPPQNDIETWRIQPSPSPRWPAHGEGDRPDRGGTEPEPEPGARHEAALRAAACSPLL